MISSDSVDGLCLDVFDTLLVRTVPEPAAAFTLLGERWRRQGRLPEGLTPEVFAQLRAAAEVRARETSSRTRNTVECRLSEVYAHLATALPHAGDPQELADLEVDLERDVCRADLGVADLIGAVNELGKPVYLISDTYFSASQLRRLLERPELQGRAIAGIYTSSDAAVNKGNALFAGGGDHERGGARKSLFDVLLGDIGTPASRLVHLGDHPEADLRGARSAGLQAVLYSKLTPQLKQVLEREGTAPVHLTEDDDIDLVDGDFGLTALRARTLSRVELEAVPPVCGATGRPAPPSSVRRSPASPNGSSPGPRPSGSPTSPACCARATSCPSSSGSRRPRPASPSRRCGSPARCARCPPCTRAPRASSRPS